MPLRNALPAAALVALAGCASQPDVGGTTQVGKVEGVFVEQYPGVFVDRRVADARVSGKPTWVHLKFVQPLSDGRRFATAAVGSDPGVEPGDLVQMRFGLTAGGTMEPIREHNRVIALIAKHGTEAALRFDARQQPALEKLTQAGS
jgi:hypothetical protein